MPEDTESFDDSSPEVRQFSMMDLFAITTILALILAPFATLIRSMDSDGLERVILMLAVHLLIAVGFGVYQFRNRMNAVGDSGDRVGVGYISEVQSPYWPQLKCGVMFLGLAFFQVGLCMSFASQDSLFDDLFLSSIVFAIQLGWATSWSFCQWFWRVYPGGVEFCEHGLILQLARFERFEEIDFRHSTLYPGRIVAVVPQGNLKNTIVIQVNASLMQYMVRRGFLSPLA
ncbi:MAG: hypothetical protein AAF483_29480 [Planctomycetota bacterium]